MRFRELAALFQGVAATAGLFSLVADDVRQTASMISRGKLDSLPAQSRKLDRKP
jgi:hypothetical protein